MSHIFGWPALDLKQKWYVDQLTLQRRWNLTITVNIMSHLLTIFNFCFLHWFMVIQLKAGDCFENLSWRKFGCRFHIIDICLLDYYSLLYDHLGETFFKKTRHVWHFSCKRPKFNIEHWTFVNFKMWKQGNNVTLKLDIFTSDWLFSYMNEIYIFTCGKASIFPKFMK